MWGVVSESIGEVAKSNKDSVGKADGLPTVGVSHWASPKGERR